MIRVAAAIIKKDNRILICQRGEGGNCPFLWEFPGGKLEQNETFEECAVRECREELSIEINLQGLFARTFYRYSDREISFAFFNADILEGKIKPTVHKEVKWVEPSELKDFEFCPADVEIVEKILSTRT